MVALGAVFCGLWPPLCPPRLGFWAGLPWCPLRVAGGLLVQGTTLCMCWSLLWDLFGLVQASYGYFGKAPRCRRNLIVRIEQ